MSFHLKWSKIKLIAVIAGAAGMLAGCIADFNASSYVKGILNNFYLGDSTVYREMVAVSEEEALEEYLQGMEAEAEFLIQYYGIDGGVSEAVHQAIAELYQEIYRHSRFEISDEVRTQDGYQVDVTVSPIDIIVNSEADILKAVDEFSKTADPEEYTDPGKLNDAVAMIMVETIREKLPELGYLEDITITVLVKKDAEGYYSIDSDTISQVDDAIIEY